MWGVWWSPCQEPDWVCTSLHGCRCSKTALSLLLPSTSSPPDLCSCTSGHMNTTAKNSLYVHTRIHTQRHLFTPLNLVDKANSSFAGNKIFFPHQCLFPCHCCTLKHRLTSSLPWPPDCLILSLYSEWHLHSSWSSLVPHLTAALPIVPGLLTTFCGGGICKHGKLGPGYN